VQLPRRVPLVLATVLLWSAAAPARAELITLPEAYSPGRDLGVTLRRLEQLPGTPTYAPVVTPAGLGGVYRDLGFGYEGCYNNGVPRAEPSVACSWFTWSLLEVSFDAPTDYVQMVGTWLSDAPAMRAYGSDGSLITSCNWVNTADCTAESVILPGADRIGQTTQTITRAERDITRVVYGGWFGNTTARQLSYRVPEPGTLMLIGIGMASAVLQRRRKK
jgi:PEP-CTERM motif-containing protein